MFASEIGEVDFLLPVRLEQNAVDKIDVDRSTSGRSDRFEHGGQAEVATPAQSTTRARYVTLRSLQRDFPRRIRSVQGLGLFISIHFKRPDNERPDIAFADAIAMEAVRSGVLMFTTGRGYLKFTPPLSIDPEAAFEGVDVIRECVERRS